MDNPPILSALNSLSNNIFVMGDFNYNYHSSTTTLPPGTIAAWIEHIQLNFQDCFEDGSLVTFRRGVQSSTINYIYSTPSAFTNVKEKQQRFLNSEWTDHALLSLTFNFRRSDRGPGTWKVNPFLARNQHFQIQFQQHLNSLAAQLSTQHSHSTDSACWDWVKEHIKHFTRSFQLEQNNWRTKQLKRLQQKRNRILRQFKNTNVLSTLLPTIESQIGSLQDQIAEIECLKAGTFWRDHNENSPGFLKKLITTRESQRYIPHLHNPLTEMLSTNTKKQLEVVESFYTRLYTPDPVDEVALDNILGHIPEALKLDAVERSFLTSSITIDEVLQFSTRSP